MSRFSKSANQQQSSSHPWLILALSRRDWGLQSLTSMSGEEIGWLTARMPGLPSERGLSPNQADVGDSGLPSLESQVGVIVLLYKPGLEQMFPKNNQFSLGLMEQITFSIKAQYQIHYILFNFCLTSTLSKSNKNSHFKGNQCGFTNTVHQKRKKKTASWGKKKKSVNI